MYCILYTLGIQSYSLMIGVSNLLLRMVFRFHYHSQKVIGSLGIVYVCFPVVSSVSIFVFRYRSRTMPFSPNVSDDWEDMGRYHHGNHVSPQKIAGFYEGMQYATVAFFLDKTFKETHEFPYSPEL